MKRIAFALIVVLATLTIQAQSNKVAETVFSSDVVRPGNMAITKSGRMFVTMNPLLGPEVKVYEVFDDGSSKAYPNDLYAKGEKSIIKAIIGIRTDKNDNLWLLDMGSKQLIVWDTKNEKELKKISIPDNVVKQTSFLQDFIIDETNNRVIIADMTQGDLKSAPESAFIVIDTETGVAKRMAEKHASMMPEFEGGFALNPIAIDSKNKWVYFGALHGKKVYRVPANSFDNEASLKADIEYYANKSYSDGIAADNKGNVYVTNIEENALGVTNAKDGFKTIATLPTGQSWPDGLWLKDGFLFSTVDQLNRVPALNNGKDDSVAPYIIVRTKLSK